LTYEDAKIRVVKAFQKTFNAILTTSTLSKIEEEHLRSLLKDKHDYSRN